MGAFAEPEFPARHLLYLLIAGGTAYWLESHSAWYCQVKRDGLRAGFFVDHNVSLDHFRMLLGHTIEQMEANLAERVPA